MALVRGGDLGQPFQFKISAISQHVQIVRAYPAH